MADSGTKPSNEDEQEQTKKKRSLAKKLSDKERDKTRINIGLAFPRWRELRELKGRAEAEGGGANDTLCFGLQAVLNSKPSGEMISLFAPLNSTVP